MPHTNTGSRRHAAAALLILLLACIGLAACGGSSSTTTATNANAAATGTTTGSTTTGTTSTGAPPSGHTPTGPGHFKPGAGGIPARFAALRECLQKNGVTLPKRTPGSAHPAGGAGFIGGGPALPKGMTRAQYEAILKKCGGGGAFARGEGRFADNPAFKQALTKYAECLRQNGVNVPPPNTSGKGPVFDTKGINTSSPQFRTATAKCRSTLTSAFRRPGGPGGDGPPGGGTPPTGGGSSG
jgi:hypothetical protein